MFQCASKYDGIVARANGVCSPANYGRCPGKEQARAHAGIMIPICCGGRGVPVSIIKPDPLARMKARIVQIPR
jgi:hypothetical protein